VRRCGAMARHIVFDKLEICPLRLRRHGARRARPRISLALTQPASGRRPLPRYNPQRRRAGACSTVPAACPPSGPAAARPRPAPLLITAFALWWRSLCCTCGGSRSECSLRLFAIYNTIQNRQWFVLSFVRAHACAHACRERMGAG
jgi:hypothetical protein